MNDFPLSKSLSLMVCFFMLAGVCRGQEKTQPKKVRGVVAEKPEEGTQFVDLGDGRFMVPYATTLPGTDISLYMVPIRGGVFRMGDNENESTSPEFRVKVEPFWMSVYETTWEQYWRFMDLGASDGGMKDVQSGGLRIVTEDNKIDAVTCPSPLYEPSVTYDAGQEDEQCAATITQYAAKQYTKWLSLSSGQFYRLPYESEWEHACRAGTTTRFYFGDDDDELEEHAWFENNSDEERHEVGELEPNPWGLYDMYGNVSEWVLDGYSEQGYLFAKGAAADKVFSVTEAYQQPKKVTQRVLRGGCFQQTAEHCNSVARQSAEDWRIADPNTPDSPWWFSDSESMGVGFRIIRPLKVPPRAQQEKFWRPDNPKIIVEYESRIEKGNGAIGIVDQELHKDLEAAALKRRTER